MTVGIVDDDKDVRTALGRLLRSLGHEVLAFSSAEEFDAHQAPLDCLILDVRLPGLSGLELRERLAARTSRLPVVLITGNSEPLTRETPGEIGDPVLAKPFGDDELIAAIAIAMARVRDDQNARLTSGPAHG